MIKKEITFSDIVTQLPKVITDLPKIATALYYNFTVKSNTEITFADLFQKTATKFPNNICIYYLDKKWTYKAFDLWTNRLANQFSSLGIRKGDVVAVLLENRPEVLAVAMAMAKIGGIVALINPAQKNKTLIHSLKLASPKLFLVGTELIQNYIDIKDELELSKKQIFVIQNELIKYKKNNIEVFDIESENFSETKLTKKVQLFAKDPVLYIYTSGTTGLPKASVISNLRWIKAYSAFGLTTLRLNDKDILYVPLPLIHGTAMLVCWSSVLAGGAAMVIKNKFSVSDFWKDIKYYNATGFGYIGEMCRYLLNTSEHPLEKNNSLQKMIGNGMRPEIWQQFKQRFDIEQVAEFYASSEGNIAFFNIFNLDQTMGFSITSYAIVEYDKEKDEIVRDKNGFCKKVGSNQIGLLLGEINERYPFDGYTEKDKTSSSVMKNVFKKGDAYFNTGDLVKDMGFLHTQFVDRLGDTFRWKSENVSTTEVESIINQYQSIDESVVYGVSVAGANGRAGMANLIFKPENAVNFDFESFYSYLSKELPPYAIPIFLKISKQTAVTSTFKYQKNELKENAYHQYKNEDIYILIDKKYVLMNDEIYEKLMSEQIRL